jgi:starvation-inducible outer membrane lipoprotein
MSKIIIKDKTSFIIFPNAVINTFSVPAVAQGSFAAAISTMKVNQQSSKQQVRVKNAKQAAQLAQSRFGGKVLKVQAQKSGYRVKLIKKNGHIIAVFVDANSGRISGR